jgi:hypothetical protein
MRGNARSADVASQVENFKVNSRLRCEGGCHQARYENYLYQLNPSPAFGVQWSPL